MDTTYGEHGWWRGAGHRMGRGDLSPIVLRVLLEKPMHGYEIIRKLEEKSYGYWRPSAGSIYPTLQLLEEQDLVTSREESGKKVYTITEAGQKAAADGMPYPPHWKQHMNRGKRFGVLKNTMKKFVIAMRQIGLSGSDEQVNQAKIVIDKAVEELTALANEVKENPTHSE